MMCRKIFDNVLQQINVYMKYIYDPLVSLPFILLFLAIVLLVLSLIEKDIDSPRVLLRNYGKSRERVRLFSQNGNSFLVGLFFISFFIVFITIIYIDSKYINYVYKMVNKIETIIGGTIAVSAIVVTTSIALIVYDKGYYILYSIRIVLKKYRITTFLAITVITCVLSVVFGYSLLDGEINTSFEWIRFCIFEVSVFYNLIAEIYVMFGIYRIIISDSFDLKPLNDLYIRLWYYEIYENEFHMCKDGYSEAAIKSNLDYLTDLCWKICKKGRIKKLDEIEFVSFVRKRDNRPDNKEKWEIDSNIMARTAIYYILGIVLCFCLSTIYIVLVVRIYSLIIINATITLLVVLAVWIFRNTRYGVACYRLINDTWMYQLRNEKKTKVYSRFFFLNIGVYKKYIRSVENVVVLFYLLLNRILKDKEDISIVADKYRELLERSNENISLAEMNLYLLIGFFVFNKDKKLNFDLLKRKYKFYIEEKTYEKRSFYQLEKMVFSELTYLLYNLDITTDIPDKRIYEYLMFIKEA